MNILPDFLIIPSTIINDEDLQPLDGYVYGVVYWYTKLKLEKCIASSKKIGEILKVKPNSIDNAIARLVKKGFLMSNYNRHTHIRELIPQVSFNKKEELELLSNPSNKGVASPQMMKGIPSNEGSTQGHLRTPNKKKEKEEGNKNNTVIVKNGVLESLPELLTDFYQIDHLSKEMAKALHDEKSLVFYRQVARRVPEQFIWEALAEIKQDGARKPAAVFTSRMKDYAKHHTVGA